MNNLKALLTQVLELECEQIIVPILLLSELKPASYVFSPLYNVGGGGFYLLQSFIRPHINFFEIGIQDWTQIILLALILETYILIIVMSFIPQFKAGAIGQLIKSQLSYIVTIAKYPFFQCIYECFLIIVVFESNIVIALLGLFFSLIMHLTILIFCKQSLHLNGIINLTSLWYICQLIGFVQIIVFVSFKDIQTAQQIQSICTLLIGLLSLFQVIYQKSIFNQTQRLIVIFTNSINIFIGFEYLVQIDGYLYKNMWIIMCPLIYQSISSKDEDISNKISNIQNMNQLSSLKYFCAQVIDFERHAQQNQIIKELFKIDHQRKCNSKTCKCQTEPFSLQFVIKQINEQFQKIIDNNKDSSDYVYLSYLQFLQETDQVIMAYQLSKQILESKDKSKKKKYDLNSRKTKVSFITHLYVQTLHYIIISKIIIRVSQVSQTKQSDNHNLLSLEIQKFIDTEIQKVQVIKGLLSILNNKMEYLTLQQQIQDDQSLYDKSTKLIEQIDLFYVVLQQNYKKYQTTKNRNILMFYQVEILNDLIKAYSLEESSPFANEIFQLIDHSDMLNNFSNQYYYIITRIHSPKNIEISSVSKNFRNIMKQDLIGQSINELIPEYVSKFHHEYVIKFFEEGKNRYFQQFSQLYVMISKGIVTPIEIAMDVDQNDKSCLSMILLFKLSENNLPTLFVDQDLQLNAMSLNLYCEVLGMNIQSAHKYLDNLPVSKVIPNFNQYIHSETQTIKNCSFYFPNSDKEVDSNWGSKSSIMKYTCNLQITMKKVSDTQYYYQVIIDSLKSKTSRKSETLILTPYLQEVVAVKSEKDNFDEEIKIEYPKGEELDEMLLITNRDTQGQQMLYQSKHDNLLEEKQFNPAGSKGPNKQEDNQQLIENYNQAVAQNKFDDGASQVTSVAQVKSSPFFKKYLLINNLINSQIQSKYMRRVTYLIIFFGILSIINMGLIIQETTLLDRFKSDIKILSIKYDVYGPFEDFLVTRYTIVNYNALLNQRIINSTLWGFYVIFPRSNLALGYDDVKSNILKVLDEYSFQDYIKDKSYTIYLYNRTNVGYERNMSFRTAVSLFLNYQYEYKLAYTIKPLFTDSPYSYFTYQNYFTLYNSFTDLNQFVLDQTLYLSSYYLDQSLILEVPFLVCVVVIYLIVIQQYYYYQQLFNKLYLFIRNTDKTSVSLEIKRLKNIFNEIKSNEEYVYQYKLDIYLREQQLKDQEQIHKQNNCDIRLKIEDLYIYQKIGYLFTSFSFVLYVGISLGASFMLVNYYQKYQPTARFYHKLSSVGVDVPTAFAQREVLYYRVSFPFLSAQYINDVYSQIDDCLVSMSDFSQTITQFDQSQYLFNDEGIQLLQNINQDSLCKYLDANFTIKSANICSNVLNGTLAKGLSASLIYMVNLVQTEKLNSNFLNARRQYYPALELEGATLISNVIKNVNTIMRTFIIESTDELKNLITLLCALFIMAQFVIVIFGIMQLREYERIKFCKLKKFVLLVPQNTLLFDDSFSRQVRLICQQEKIF